MLTRRSARARNRGFTLLEVMITVAIVGILAAIALPSYSYFITRSRIIEATTALGDVRNQMEKYYMDFRRYDSGGACGPETQAFKPITAFNATSTNFQLSCPAASLTATTYILQADGIGPMAGFQYRVDQTNAKSTSALPAGWSLPAPNNCWALRKDGTC
jgi:type IV pilus assembly protein PilE